LAPSRTIFARLLVALVAWTLAFAPQARSEAMARAQLDLEIASSLCLNVEDGSASTPDKSSHAGHVCCDLCCQLAAAILPPSPPSHALSLSDRVAEIVTGPVGFQTPVTGRRVRSGESRAPPGRRFG
jgi:hypothetical protein